MSRKCWENKRGCGREQTLYVLWVDLHCFKASWLQAEQQASIAFTQSSAVMKQDGLDRWRTDLRRQADTVDIGSWDYRTLNSRPASAAGLAMASDGSILAVREALGPYAYETREQGQRLADNLMQGLVARKEVHVAAGTVRTLTPGTSFALHGHAQHDAAGSDDERTFVVTRRAPYAQQPERGAEG